jgi:hypothetical protein
VKFSNPDKIPIYNSKNSKIPTQTPKNSLLTAAHTVPGRWRGRGPLQTMILPVDTVAERVLKARRMQYPRSKHNKYYKSTNFNKNSPSKQPRKICSRALSRLFWIEPGKEHRIASKS